MPVRNSINIKKERDNKEQYLELLLDADPSKEMISKYLNDGELFVLTNNDEPVCVSVVTKIDNNTVELKNIATTENNIPFYVKQGFDKYEKTIKNFFIDNYNKEIKDDNLICTDLIYYSKELKK